MAYRIALADDSETIRKVVQLVLEPEGFTIAAYRNGEEALEAIALDPPDLVFADIDLPKMSGVLLCTSIKDDPSTSHIPVILLVGAFEAFDEDAARLSGADDIIIKPFESRELASKVKALVSKKTAKTFAESLQSPRQSELSPSDSQFSQNSDGSDALPVSELHAQPQVDACATQDKQSYGRAASMEAETAALTPVADEALSEDEKLAREWAASMEAEENAPALTDAPKPAVPFAAVLEGAIAQQSADIVRDFPQSAPPVAGAGAAVSVPVLSDRDREEIRSMVRSAVDEALAELLQSERSRIQGEIETAVRNAVREVAEAILKRELDRTVSQD